MTPRPDPDWQAGCVLVLVLWCLFALIRGWANGPLRLLVKPAALVLTWILVCTFGGAVTAMVARSTGWSAPLCSLVGPAALGLIAYQVLCWFGQTVFKRTRDHAEPLTRTIFGVTGAMLGLAYSLFWIWAAVVLIRFAGHFAAEQPAGDLARGSAPDPWVTNVVRLQASVESVLGKRLVDACDPVPPWVYERIDGIARLVASPVALRRLISYPGFQRAWDDTKVRALAADPTIVHDLQQGDYWAMLADPRFWDLLSSPEWWEIVFGPQFDAALRYALEGT
ncbi:MAG: hypothetical protein JOY92_06830 [Verrucomicrobia bacterium]|nr:hypothetical protein [Verrucomicrobiota bacterium]